MKKIILSKKQYKTLLESLNQEPTDKGGLDKGSDMAKKYNLKEEYKNLLEYLYGKSKNLSEFWNESNVKYEAVLEGLKDILVKEKDGYKLSKKLGSPQDALKIYEETLNEIVGGINEGDWFDNHPDNPINQEPQKYPRPTTQESDIDIKYYNGDIAIVSSEDGLLSIDLDDYNSEFMKAVNSENSKLTNIAVSLGYAEDSNDGYWTNNDDQIRQVLINYIDSNYDKLTPITDEVKNDLLDFYSEDDELNNLLNGEGEEDSLNEIVGESDTNLKHTKRLIDALEKYSDYTEGVVQTNQDGEKYRYDNWILKYRSANNILAALFNKACEENTGNNYSRQFTSGDYSFYFERPEFRGKPNGRITMKKLVVLDEPLNEYDSDAKERNKIKQQLGRGFTATDKPKTDVSADALAARKNITGDHETGGFGGNYLNKKKKVLPKVQPQSKNPEYTQTRLPFDEATTAGAIGGGVSVFGGGGAGARLNTPVPQFGKPLKRTFKEGINETTEGEGSIGAYDANALSIGRNGEFNKGEQPRAFKEPQWAGGTFPQQPECSKPNNNKEAQNGGCNSGASSLKLKKGKGSVNAPTLAKENKIYETIAKQTGRTLDEVKRIIEFKNNK
jgi:hypothetical protein